MYLATHAAHTTAAACVSTAIASLLSVKLSALQDTVQAWVSIVTAAPCVLWCLHSEETHCPTGFWHVETSSHAKEAGVMLLGNVASTNEEPTRIIAGEIVPPLKGV